MASSQRINKYLALQLGLSRREADDMIAAGRVTINGTRAQLGAQFQSTDTVKLDGSTISKALTSHQYLVLHKPVGYVCSRKAQGENPTIYELLPKNFHHLKPVGRLDKDSSGLILLTNDGDFAHHMTHPSFKKAKIYEVELDQPLQPLHHQMIVDYGVALPDGTSQFGLEKLSNDATRWQITMHEGRNRQIRRTFAALGYTVIKLHRTMFGYYELASLKPGDYQAFHT